MDTPPRLFLRPQLILENYQTMANIFNEFQIHYAMKANSYPEIIELLERSGSCFETASWSEISDLLKMGITPERIIFSNPVKSIFAIKKAIEHGVQKFVFDSVGELGKFKEIGRFKDIQLFFRITVSSQGSVWNLNEKFGCPEMQWREIYRKMNQENIPLAGITFHVGSQCESLKPWGNALVSARRSIELSHEYNLKPDTINIGGGFPVKYTKEVPSLKNIHDTIYQHIRLWSQEKLGITKFMAEPGRILVGSAGTFRTTIIGISQKNDKTWVHLDSGLFSGMMETIHGAIQYPVFSYQKRELQKVHLCGPTCDSLDVLYEVTIPQPMVGDELDFCSAGAYTNVYSTSFNGFEPPQVLFLNEENYLSRALA